MPRGHQAALPPPSFEVPASLSADGLVVTGTSPDGKQSFRYDLTKRPGSLRLRQDIGVALSAVYGPNGSWRSTSTMRTGTHRISQFLRWLDQQENPPESLTGLRVAHWDAFRLAHPARESAGSSHLLVAVRAVLKASPVIRPEVAEALTYRIGKPQTEPSIEAYTIAEYESIRRGALRVVAAAARRIGHSTTLIGRLRSNPASLPTADKSRAEALLKFHHGEPLGLADWKAADGYLNRRRVSKALTRQLYLTPDEAWACVVLLICENGWNLASVNDMKAPDSQAGHGEPFDVFTVEVLKPRRGHRGRMTNTLVDSGSTSVGRSMSRVLTATAPARSWLRDHDLSADNLIIWEAGSRAAERFLAGVPNANVLYGADWATDLPRVSPQRLRRAYQNHIRRGPAQNTRRVHEDRYLLRDAPIREASEHVTVQGLDDALTTATASFKMRLLPLRDVSDGTATGRNDTPLGACEDVHHHPETGTTCEESFLACLDCSNAVATPKHLPRLVFMLACIDGLASVLDDTLWATRWGAHRDRLAGLLAAHTTKTEREDALEALTSADRQNVLRLIGGEYDA